MMLGKRARARPPMRRTTSMTEFAGPDVLADVEGAQKQAEEGRAHAKEHHRYDGAGQDWPAAYHLGPHPSTLRGPYRRNSADLSVVETAAFLRACGLCKRRLGPGRDTFMYRGDTAFCSLECRQQHITQEEWKEKCTRTPMKEAAPAVSTGSEKSSTGETVAAA